MTAVNPFYELLLKWLTSVEKMVRIGREMLTCVQEWVNRECVDLPSKLSFVLAIPKCPFFRRELVMGAMRFQFGMRISIPYLPRPLELSADTLDVRLLYFMLSRQACESPLLWVFLVNLSAYEERFLA